MGGWWSQNEEIEKLKKEIEELKQTQNQNNKPKSTDTKISRESLIQWVNNQLSDPTTNITLMPDFVERRLKVQIFEMILNMFDYILETTKVEFMGQKIVFDFA